MKPAFVKIWVDDRGGQTKKLTPPMYLAIIEEAHKANVPVAAHSITLEDCARQRLKEMGATSALKLRAAGMKIVLGGDTGQARFFIGWSQQLEFENWGWMGLTPSEAIVAATRDSAAAGHFNTGMVAADKNADFIVLDANPLEPTLIER
jgi:imidazolonepropionase-like amidohydrolase